MIVNYREAGWHAQLYICAIYIEIQVVSSSADCINAYISKPTNKHVTQYMSCRSTHIHGLPI